MAMEKSSQYHGKASSRYFITVYFIIAVLCSIMGISNGCTCAPAHPQEQACRADFVILATVKKYYPLYETHQNVHGTETGYHLKIRRIYKAPANLRLLLHKHGRIVAPSENPMIAACGVKLKINHTYLLTGRAIEVFDHRFTEICPNPLPKRWAVTEEDQDKLRKYADQHKCSCDAPLTEVIRNRLVRYGKYTLKEEETKCTIIKKGAKRYVRGAIRATELRMNLCNFHTEFNQLTPRQWKGFQKLYYRGCDCNIGFLNYYTKRHSQNSPNSPLGCMFKLDEKNCEYDHGICLPNSQDGLCNWTPNPAQLTCEMN